jgi:UDP-N-acetylenolpyruvoylglucosamine reductase
MNAGAFGGELSQVVKVVSGVHPDGRYEQLRVLR